MKKAFKNSLIALGTCLTTSIAFQCCCQASPAVWQLEQYSDNLGACQVYISHDAAKVVCKKLKCEVLTFAPDWQVHCYRTDEKIEWINDLANFGGDSMSNPFARVRNLKKMKLTELGSGNINGLFYTKYKTKKSLKICSTRPMTSQ